MVQFIPAKDMKIKKEADGGRYEMEDLYKIVASHADRLGVDREVAFENAIKFADTVGLLENDGKLEGTNRPQKGKDKSTAKGLYQFLDGSVGPAKERLGRHIDVSQYPDDPNEMTWNQQTTLLIADLLEKNILDKDGNPIAGAGDKLMRPVLEDASNTEAVKNAYYVLHHTKPDEATMKRTESILGKGLRKYQEETKGVNSKNADEIPMDDGNVMTEMTIGVTFDGEDMDIPLIVPTLSEDELRVLKGGGALTSSMVNKAVDYARTRLREGKDVYAN